MAVKRFLYFAANDTLPMNLIRKADELHTGLDDMELLEMYGVITSRVIAATAARVNVIPQIGLVAFELQGKEWGH